MGITYHLHWKREKPCYLSLVTDGYSKKIMGYYIADNVTTESSLMALKMTVKNRQDKDTPLIHHSDRGLQYCAHDYQKILNKTAYNAVRQTTETHMKMQWLKE